MSFAAEGLAPPCLASSRLAATRVDATARGSGLAPADLCIRGLRKAFPGGGTVLEDVTFDVPRGGAIALLGSNGCGKSTLLRLCVGLLPFDEGSVRLLGQDVATLRGRALRRFRARIGFVFQRHNLVPRLSVLSNVVQGAFARPDGGYRCLRQGLAPATVRERAMDCLRRVGLDHLAARRTDGLSGGESQRVAIARALMAEPEFMIADEPVASLDPAVGEEVMALFAGLARESGITLLFTSHHLGHALTYAERAIGLKHGHVFLDAPTSALTLDSFQGLYG